MSSVSFGEYQQAVFLEKRACRSPGQNDRKIRDQVSRDGADEKCLVGWFVVGVSDLRS
jgi:hypothetical protein